MSAQATEQRQTVPHTRRVRLRAEGTASAMQLNLTAMIDVIFLLLIYFVITANFTADEGVLTALLPRGPGPVADASRPPEQPLRITLQSFDVASCLILVAGERMESFTGLAELLSGLQYDPDRGRVSGVYPPDNPVIIEPDGFVRWQHVVNAFNAAVRARYTNVRFGEGSR